MNQQPPKKRTAPSPFKAGALCRCPYCGQGPLYEQFITVAAKCRICGRSFKNAEQGDGAAVFVIFVLGFLILGAAVIVEFAYAPPMWLHLVVWPPLILLGTIGMLRPFKAFIIAMQFQNDAREGRLAKRAAADAAEDEA